MSQVDLPTVLVVDDEDDLRYFLSESIRSIPCATIEAQDGLAALQHIKSRKVDVVVSDIRMPSLSGLDLLEMARMYGFSGPVIVMTAFGRKGDVIEALRLGAFDFIEKPFEQRKILDAVREAVDVASRMKSMADTNAPSSQPLVMSRNLHQAVTSQILGAEPGKKKAG